MLTTDFLKRVILMSQPEIKQFESKDLPMKVAGLIQDNINSVLSKQGKCGVMLTGGRSAARLYKAWRDLPAFQQMTGVNFYFGDERCVPPDHDESNYGMVMQSLFPNGVPSGCSVFRMEADAKDIKAEAQRYADLLPDSIDSLLLGVGEDGHIASLFPNNSAIQERNRRVIPITGPKPPFGRLPITPPVIAQAKSIFVLATGIAKAKVLSKARQTPSNFVELPACLVLSATWLLDTVVTENIFL
jgi:6-phosphogluconolactonase